MTAPWPCSTCGAPGFKNLGTDGYCPAHLAELYRTFQPESWDLAGIGLPEGHRPEHGPEFHALRCVACGATWTGPMFAPCTWCDDARGRLVEYRAQEVLRPPDVDPDDERFDNRMAGWAERLVVAVAAGIVTEAQADRAWRRVHRDAAA